MLNKKLIIAWIVVFVAWMAGSFFIHGLLLMNDYSQLPNLMRPQEGGQKYYPLNVLAHVIMPGAFVWIYSQGVAAKPWLPQGLRFGVAVVLLTAVPTFLIYYVVQPLPGLLVIKQIVFSAILVVLLGVLAAFLYRQAPAGATAPAPAPARGPGS